MPTNEERMYAAARLRVLADENTVTATPNFNHVLFAALGGEPPAAPSTPTLKDLEAYDWALLYRLADLIEPEERTCFAVIPNEIEGYVFCPKCGAEIGEYGVPNYCHNCGKRVVK